MTPLMMLFLGLVMVATAFLSGLFGMAGGMVLIGVLLAFLPVPTAMVLHAVTQMASNGWRAWLWRRHVRWRSVAAYAGGALLALVAWSIWSYVPSKPVAFIFLGLTPFLLRLAPASLAPDPESAVQGVGYGAACMTLMLLTGVSGPLLDSFFLGGRLDRRQIVATKATCQILGHGMKLAYFGGMIADAGQLDPKLAVMAILASMLGTTLARRFLEAMTDTQYRRWAGHIITVIAGYFLIQGSWLLVVPA
ncbi:putative membrane protein YfcA [Stella humosa]|uniref:Probable membrane transporter protein n=1 Tax=Stella humosa TaxID=94 RepID=A0A3N1LD80_9PROT|nr:sulfite exporter TauE/SafE family protein [Stella humosa]ROP91021.1 putative membrane protein YfcA [Stella humosa]BBK34629.1 permease [Stella humosa]